MSAARKRRVDLELRSQLWRHIPGDESDHSDAESWNLNQESCCESDDELAGDEPQEGGASAWNERSAREFRQSRLKEVLEQLGDRWVDTPCLEFTPPPVPAQGPTSKRTTAPIPLASRWASGPSGNGLPMFRVERIHAPLVKDVFLNAGMRPTGGPNWLVLWSGPRRVEESFESMHEYQRANHFPSSTELTRKDRLWVNFHKMEQLLGRGAYDFLPRTFILPEQGPQFKKHFAHDDGIWIVKPQASAQGKGIFLLRDVSELDGQENVVVSHYVDNPLLIQGLKFDLRIYVLVTSFDPLRAYIYREGLTRFASKEYSAEEEHLGDVYRHLTNYSINKNANNFQENQSLQADNVGHKWSLSALNRHLRATGVDIDLMWNRIMDLIVKTLLSVEPVIAKKTRAATIHGNCFELYGFDVLVDDTLKPWLLEVNLSPSMAADSPLDWQIKGSVLSDAFNLIGLRHVDQQTAATSRLRARLLQLRRLTEKADDGAQQRQPEGTTLLEGLSEPELKMLANALEEVGRMHNFIRLYPTRESIWHYRPITKQRSDDEATRAELLASMLYGPLTKRPPQSQRWQGANREEQRERRRDRKELERERAHAGRGDLFRQQHRGLHLAAVVTPCGRSRGSSASGNNSCEREREDQREILTQEKMAPPAPLHDPVRAGAALRVLMTFGKRMCFQLALIEYLVRICASCARIQEADFVKLERSGAVPVLQAFRQRLSTYVRSRAKARKIAIARSIADTEDSVSQLVATCKAAAACAAGEAWQGGGAHERTPALERLGQLSTVAQCAPKVFLRSVNGQRAVVSLSELSPADLEAILSSQESVDEFGPLLDNPEDDLDFNPIGSSGRLRRRLRECEGIPNGPLSELLQAAVPSAPQLRGPQPPRPPALPRGPVHSDSATHSLQKRPTAVQRPLALSTSRSALALPPILSAAPSAVAANTTARGRGHGIILDETINSAVGFADTTRTAAGFSHESSPTLHKFRVNSSSPVHSSTGGFGAIDFSSPHTWMQQNVLSKPLQQPFQELMTYITPGGLDVDL